VARFAAVSSSPVMVLFANSTRAGDLCESDRISSRFLCRSRGRERAIECGYKAIRGSSVLTADASEAACAISDVLGRQANDRGERMVRPFKTETAFNGTAPFADPMTGERQRLCDVTNATSSG